MGLMGIDVEGLEVLFDVEANDVAHVIKDGHWLAVVVVVDVVVVVRLLNLTPVYSFLFAVVHCAREVAVVVENRNFMADDRRCLHQNGLFLNKDGLKNYLLSGFRA